MLDNEVIVFSRVFFFLIVGMWLEEFWFFSGGIYDFLEEG